MSWEESTQCAVVVGGAGMQVLGGIVGLILGFGGVLPWPWALSPLWIVQLFWGAMMIVCLLCDAYSCGWPKLKRCRPSDNPNWFFFVGFQVGMLALAVSLVASIILWNPLPFLIVVGLWGLSGLFEVVLVLPDALS